MKKITKSKTIIILNGFEKISESQEKKLLGGFSHTITNPSTGIDDGTTNNCQGGNCTFKCGVSQNVNCVKGCGE